MILKLKLRPTLETPAEQLREFIFSMSGRRLISICSVFKLKRSSEVQAGRTISRATGHHPGTMLMKQGGDPQHHQCAGGDAKGLRKVLPSTSKAI